VTDPSASRRLARWALGLRLDDIPAPVRAAARRHILDALGCGLGARRFGEAGPVLRVAERLGGPAEATVIGGARTGAATAALANGALMHALDFDDTHAGSLVHATVAVLPAALAASEEAGTSGADLLVAVVAGIEAATRLGAAVPHGFHAHGFHATSVCGTFASALACARLQGSGEDAAVNALGIAGSFASGSLEFLADGSSTKQLHPGWAAHAGLVAARLAAAGATGPQTILEGESGLYRSFLGRTVEAAQLVDGLGSRWETGRITIKPYPACQLSHASLDAARSLGVEARDVAGLHFRLPEEAAAIVCRPEAAKLHPRSPYEAKFSLQWCAAALLIDGALGTESFAPGRIERPDVLALAARVGYEAYDPGRPAASAGGEVTATLRDGGTRRAEVAASRGGPENPLGEAEVLEKFRLNAGPGHDALVEAVLGLEALPSAARLSALLSEPAGVPR
jgi:2-methylcitrate dehydratase PrpD